VFGHQGLNGGHHRRTSLFLAVFPEAMAAGPRAGYHDLGANTSRNSASSGRFAGRCLAILVMVLKFLGYALIFVLIVVVPAGLLIGLPLRFVTRWRARRKPPTPPLATPA